MLKIAVVAPMASASVTTTIPVKAGVRTSIRKAYFVSRANGSSGRCLPAGSISTKIDTYNGSFLRSTDATEESLFRRPLTRKLFLTVYAFFLVSAIALAAAVTVHANRLAQSPILSPRQGWLQLGIFNPAAISAGTKTVLLFRAQDRNHTSRIGYAESSDRLHFIVRPEPVLWPETAYEQGGGLEDPRVVKIGDLYYLTYTGYNLHDAQLCLATSHDLVHWQRHGVILPAYKGAWNTQWTKSGSILPRQINGKWWMYYLGTKRDSDNKARDYMGLASSTDLLHWSDATNQPVLDRRPGAFDSRVMEPGPPPFLTEAGILLLYNGANEDLVYGPGWVLFDSHDPSRVLARAARAFITPELPWEKIGNVPNVIFLEDAISHGSNQFTGYYGAADKYIGAMEIHINF